MRIAIEDAACVAGLLITTEATINKPGAEGSDDRRHGRRTYRRDEVVQGLQATETQLF